MLTFLACSGPGAGLTIRENIVISLFCAAISAVIVGAIALDDWRLGRFGGRLGIGLVLLAIHPAWTVSAIHGDCGYQKRDLSCLVVALLLGLLVCQFVVSANSSQPVPPRVWRQYSLRTLCLGVTLASAFCAYAKGSWVPAALLTLATIAVVQWSARRIPRWSSIGEGG